jgi:hypothetical protein
LTRNRPARIVASFKGKKQDNTMADSEAGEPSDRISSRDISIWLSQEIADLSKAVELRIKEATSLAIDYASGTISQEKAEERIWQYQHRWGEALHGVHATRSTDDDKILAAIDQTHEANLHRKSRNRSFRTSNDPAGRHGRT